MNKIVLLFIGIITVASAGWFGLGGDTNQDTPMLQSTPYAAFEKVIGHKALMIEFGSEHCHSCQKMGKILYKIKQTHPDATIFFVDIRKELQIAKIYDIRVIPTQKFIDKHGKVIETHMGVLQQDILEKTLKKAGILK